MRRAIDPLNGRLPAAQLIRKQTCQTKGGTTGTNWTELASLCPLRDLLDRLERPYPDPPKIVRRIGPRINKKCSLISGKIGLSTTNKTRIRGALFRCAILLPPKPSSSPFDQPALIANAGVLPAVLLTRQMMVGELVDERLGVVDRVANANRGDKLLTLTYSSVLGGEWISDVAVLGSGETSRILGIRPKAPSAVGTFLRGFRWANVRQLDAVPRIVLKRAWALGAGPGDGPFKNNVDSTLCQTYGSLKHNARELAYTGQKGYHPLLATVGGTGEVLRVRLREGRANPGRGGADFVAEAISRARYAGAKGPIAVRADSGFCNYAFAAAYRRRGARFSVTTRRHARLDHPPDL